MQARKAKRKADRKYDESMAYNKNLSSEARLHYLENERAIKDGTSMYGKGPNAFGAADVVAIASTLAPYVKPVLSGIESLGAGERFSEGFSMKKKKSLKKDITEFGKTDIGTGLKEKGMTMLDKLIQETGKTLKGTKMTGKEKGPNLMGMGKKEKRGAIGGALAGGLMYGPLGALAGGLAGKAFGKGRDRKDTEGASMMSGKKGPNMKSRKRIAQDYARNEIVDRKEGRTKDADYEQKQATRVAAGESPMMMGNSISKHMGGRGCNMYGDGPDMLMSMSVLGRKGRKEARENIKDVILAPARLASNIATKIAGEGDKTRKEARQEVREARQERRLNKIEGTSMYGKKPMMMGNKPMMMGKKPMMKGENVIVRDAKSGGKNQYDKYGK